MEELEQMLLSLFVPLSILKIVYCCFHKLPKIEKVHSSRILSYLINNYIRFLELLVFQNVVFANVIIWLRNCKLGSFIFGNLCSINCINSINSKYYISSM